MTWDTSHSEFESSRHLWYTPLSPPSTLHYTPLSFGSWIPLPVLCRAWRHLLGFFALVYRAAVGERGQIHVRVGHTPRHFRNGRRQILRGPPMHGHLQFHFDAGRFHPGLLDVQKYSHHEKVWYHPIKSPRGAIHNEATYVISMP